jgi:hypothetical protein
LESRTSTYDSWGTMNFQTIQLSRLIVWE